jgi:mRNA interferase RelE/StbE
VTARYELGTAPPARRALATLLPAEVAAAAAEFITGPLLADPRRVGKPLGAELAGIYSARLGREWRVLYEIDEAKHAVVVLDTRHRSIVNVMTATRGGQLPHMFSAWGELAVFAGYAVILLAAGAVAFTRRDA